MAPKKPKPNSFKPNRFTPGQLVQFYDEGLRSGNILSLHRNGTARVRPIGPYKANPAKAKTIAIADLIAWHGPDKPVRTLAALEGK